MRAPRATACSYSERRVGEVRRRDHDAVAIRVIGPRGGFRGVVEVAGQRAHRIELAGHAPVRFLAATGEHDVLHAMPDHVGGGADAVRGGRAGGRQRVADALDREYRGRRRRHGLGGDPDDARAAARARRASRPGVGSSPASAIASRIATIAYAAASPMKRFCLRSMLASRSISGTPATCERRPSPAYSGIWRMPLRPARSAADTLSRPLPRLDTMPMPVTTTRRNMLTSPPLTGTDPPACRRRYRFHGHRHRCGRRRSPASGGRAGRGGCRSRS